MPVADPAALIARTVAGIAAPDRAIMDAAERRQDELTKPPGSLGALEALATRIAGITGQPRPRLDRRLIVIAAADHGVTAQGVSAYPSEVTAQMVANFLAGGAAINVLARQAGLALVVADAGVAHDFGVRPNLLDTKVASGTSNYLEGAAMSAEQCAQAMQHGVDVVAGLAAQGCNVLGFGEMGIGNTASASLLTHCLTGLPLADVVGRGTGLDDAGVTRKRAMLQKALDIWTERRSDPLAVLARFGGFEIAMLAGAMLAAAERRMTLLIDGFIVTSALLVAAKIAPAILDYCVFAHCSEESGHRLQLQHLQATPLLNLGLRLGEGTGAALAYPLLAAACAFLNEMASFDSAGVSEKSA